MLVVDGTAIRKSLTMADCIDVMRRALHAFGEGKVYQPPRVVLQPEQLNGFAFLKPAAVAAEQVSFGLKVITFFPDNPSQRGIPAINGFVALFDAETGAPQAILDGGVVTEIRTAAVSAVATDLVAPAHAGDLALVGAGVQARAHLAAMAAVRELRRVRVWNHNPETAQAFVGWASDEGHTVEPVDSVQAAIEGADLICTVTSTREPLVDGDWVTRGAHINAVGSFEATTRELHANLVAKAAVVVDSREECAKAAGDLLLAMEDGAVSIDSDFPELGELLAGKRTLDREGKEITLFESLGLALEDVAAAAHVVAAAREHGLGVEVSL
jgi:ornithine cyclodeaminase